MSLLFNPVVYWRELKSYAPLEAYRTYPSQARCIQADGMTAALKKILGGYLWNVRGKHLRCIKLSK